MKLYMHLIRKAIQEIDEARFNQEFPIFAQYHVISLCALAVQEPIPNHKYVCELYFRYQKAKKEGNRQKVVNLVNQLKREELEAEYLIKKCEAKFRKVNTEENIRADVWTIDSVGVLAHEDTD